MILILKSDPVTKVTKQRIIFRPGRDIYRTEIAKTEESSVHRQSVNIVSFNCKNVKTSVHAINEQFKNNDIILLQKHWLFQCQIDNLEEIRENTCYTGKGTAKTTRLNQLRCHVGMVV